jgi:hypothetical protein
MTEGLDAEDLKDAKARLDKLGESRGSDQNPTPVGLLDALQSYLEYHHGTKL